jgi:hypothetical protein
MDITIIGTGNMGRGIATRALAGEHSVTLLGTETAKAEALADELSGDVRAGQVGDPLAGEVVVLAVWYAAVDDILSRYGDQLDGKVVVDITNPIDVDAFEPLELEAGSAAQDRHRRRPAPDRRRPAPARARARGARLPPHGGAGAARHGLLQRGEDSRLARATARPPRHAHQPKRATIRSP